MVLDVVISLEALSAMGTIPSPVLQTLVPGRSGMVGRHVPLDLLLGVTPLFAAVFRLRAWESGLFVAILVFF